jgi:putative phosphoribosyl transferase
MYFKNRTDAGKLLYEKLSTISLDKKNTIIIALPKGGVPVAFEVARRFELPLEIVLVRKIGLPSAPELAIGAVSEDDEVYYNSELMQYFNYKIEDLVSARLEATQELLKLGKELGGGLRSLLLEGKTVILIDDGIATGSTMEVVIQLMKKKKVKKIFIAAPVVSPDVVRKFSDHTYKVVSVIAPQFLTSVGEWYEEYNQVESSEVIQILKRYSSIRAHKEFIIST